LPGPVWLIGLRVKVNWLELDPFWRFAEGHTGIGRVDDSIGVAAWVKGPCVGSKQVRTVQCKDPISQTQRWTTQAPTTMRRPTYRPPSQIHVGHWHCCTGLSLASTTSRQGRPPLPPLPPPDVGSRPAHATRNNNRAVRPVRVPDPSSQRTIDRTPATARCNACTGTAIVASIAHRH
jgi:hypothetical protein